METEEWNLGIRGMVLSGPIVHPRWQFAYAERLCKAHVRHPDGSRDNVVTGLTMRRFASDGPGPRERERGPSNCRADALWLFQRLSPLTLVKVLEVDCLQMSRSWPQIR